MENEKLRTFYKVFFCLVIGVGCGVSLSNHFFRLWQRSVPVQALTIFIFSFLCGLLCFFIINKFAAFSAGKKSTVWATFFSVGVVGALLIWLNPITIDLPDPITEHEFHVTALGEKNVLSHSDTIEIVEIKVDDQKIKLGSLADDKAWTLSSNKTLVSSGQGQFDYVFEAGQGVTVAIVFNVNQNSGLVSFELDGQSMPTFDLYQQGSGQRIVTCITAPPASLYAITYLLYIFEYIFLVFTVFLMAFLLQFLPWKNYFGKHLQKHPANGNPAFINAISVLGVVLAGGVLATLAVSQIKAAFSSHYFAPMTNVEEAAYTYTSANNYIKYGFMNSLFLQDFSNSQYSEGHPYVYTHMPAGPDILLSLLLRITNENYQFVRVIVVLLVLTGMYFYYFFAGLILSGLNIRVNAAGYAIALIGPWTLVRLMESQIYPLLPFLAFFPIFAMQKYIKTGRNSWLFLFALVSFLSSIYIEYSLLIGIVFCYVSLYQTQLIRFEKKYILIYMLAIASGIILHLIQNLLYFGPALFIREFSILLSNRITGYPTQEALFDFYQAISVVHHGAHPIDINTLLLQIAASLHVNSMDRIIYLVLMLTILINLLGKMMPQLNKGLTFRELILPLPAPLKYFGGLLLWMGMIVLFPIIMFPAFAQEVNIGSFGGNFFFSIFVTAVLCFSINQCVQLLVAFYKNSIRLSIHKNHFRGSLFTDYFALSFYKTKINRRNTSLILHRKPYYLWLLGIFFVGLLSLNVFYVLRAVSHLGRFTVDQMRLVWDVQQITPAEIDLDSSLADLQKFSGQLFMTNINSPTVGFLVEYPGYGVCDPESISKSGEINTDRCSIEFIKPTDVKTRSQRPRYFFYFNYPPLFPGFADCMPSTTMVGARGGDACMDLMKQHLSSNYEMIFENDTFAAFDLQQKR